ncbi:MAG TPA: alpha/beta fold hydrolase [Bryobacteraceae bacterium]|nr:alpha/beta fold hydrolase [Bryobacteraceae bacterium]
MRNVPIVTACEDDSATGVTAPETGDVFGFPLSLAQERLWAAERQHPANPAYNASFRLRLEGPLDSALFQRVIDEIVRRHEALRTTFASIDGQTVQLVQPWLELPIEVEDLSALPPSQRDATMEKLCLEEAKLPFDLSKSPLIRVRLLKIENEDHVLTLTLHLIICDGWSIGILLDEIEKIYRAFAAGEPSPLPEPSIQYADYAVWQKEWLETANLSEQIAYWREKLRRYRVLEIPPDNRRGRVDTFPGKIISLALPPPLTNALRTLSGRLGGTMFTTTLAAFKALLARYTDRTDISVGSPLAGRDRGDTEGVIGLFVNPVVLRTDLSGDPSLEELAARVRNTVFDAFSNHDVPYEKLLQILRPKGNPYSTPFYRVNFICQREYARAATFVQEFAGIHMRSMPSKCQGALYDLQFFLVERIDGWRLSCEYNTDLYQEETAWRMLRHFREILEIFVETPSCRISELPVSPNPDTLESSGSELAALSLRMPASLAQHRYWLLEQFASGKVLLHLPASVRIRGTLDVSLVERALEALARRYEILRTTFIFEDERLWQVISPEGSIPLSVTSLAHLPDLEREAEALHLLREQARRPFDLAAGPLARATLYQLDAHDHVLLLDVHHIISDGWSQGLLQRQLWQIYAAFASGEKSSLPELKLQYADFAQWQQDSLAGDGFRPDLEYWKDRLRSPLPVLNLPSNRPFGHRGSTASGVETLALPLGLGPSLHSFCKRESVTAFTVMLACFKALLFHHSGQTDILVGSPIANRTEETEGLIGPFSGQIALRSSLTGDPSFRNLIARVMDVTLDAFSHNGIPFERVLETIDVQCRGGRNPIFQFYFYYQTAFLQAQEIAGLTIRPLSTVSQGTNCDLQIGFVERPEGLRAILEYNADLFDGSTMRRLLDQFVVLLESGLASPEKPLSQLLFALRAMPLIEAGESVSLAPDSGAGPCMPASDLTAARRTYVPARNESEARLVAIWEDLLGVRPVGVTDDFFDMNGRSVLALQLFQKIKGIWGKNLPLSTLFQAPTIARLAELLQGGQAPAWSSIVSIQAGGSKPPLYLISGLGGNVVRFHALARYLGPDQPVYALQPPGLDGQRPFLTNLEDMAAHYIAEIRKAQPSGPYHLAGYSFGGLVTHEMACQLLTHGEEPGLVALLDTREPGYAKKIRQTLPLRDRMRQARHRLHGLLSGDRRMDDINRILQKRTSQVAYRVHRALGRPLPQAVGTIEDINTFAATHHRAKVYRGRLTVLRSPVHALEAGYDPALGWGKLSDELDLYEIPGDHHDITAEPHVRILAERLALCLENARPRPMRQEIPERDEAIEEAEEVAYVREYESASGRVG